MLAFLEQMKDMFWMDLKSTGVTDVGLARLGHMAKMELVERGRPDPLDGNRLLLGFSTSGYGAFSLFLRHPGLFAKAAAWDAPLGMTTHNRYGAAETYGTQENFNKYSVWDGDWLPEVVEFLTS